VLENDHSPNTEFKRANRMNMKASGYASQISSTWYGERVQPFRSPSCATSNFNTNPAGDTPCFHLGVVPSRLRQVITLAFGSRVGRKHFRALLQLNQLACADAARPTATASSP
jgi:hypothetical protein